MSSNLLQLEGLCRRYSGAGGVVDVSVHIPHGAIYALCGPNGAGKSTTLGVVAGLLFARQGTLRLDEVDIPLERWRRRIGVSYLPERPVIDTRLTPWQWCGFVASLKEVTPTPDAADLLKCLRLDDDTMSAPLATLSFGTIRKVALFAELITTTRCLLLDEPLSGLDPAAVEGFHAALRAFVLQGRSVLLSTHLLSEAESVATHVGILVAGRTIAEGRLADLCGPESLRTTYHRLTTEAEELSGTSS